MGRDLGAEKEIAGGANKITFDGHLARKRHHLGDDPRPIFGNLHGVGGTVGLLEQVNGSKDGGHQVVVWEIDAHLLNQWGSFWR